MKRVNPLSAWFYLPLAACQVVALVIDVLDGYYTRIVPTLAMLTAICLFFWATRRMYQTFNEHTEALEEVNKQQAEKIDTLLQDCAQAKALNLQKF